jgi:transposase
MLRESRDLAEKIPEAVPLYEALRNLYDRLIDALKNDPPPEVRRVLWYLARARLNQLLDREYANLKVKRKIIGTLRNSKGTSIHERLMTVLATWSQQGLDSLPMLRLKLSS